MAGGKQWVDVRSTVLERDNHTCQHCGAKPDDSDQLHVHHIVPEADGGTETTSNAITLCVGCHRDLHAELKAVDTEPTIQTAIMDSNRGDTLDEAERRTIEQTAQELAEETILEPIEAEVWAFRDAGLGVDEIGKEIGRSRSTVFDIRDSIHETVRSLRRTYEMLELDERGKLPLDE